VTSSRQFRGLLGSFALAVTVMGALISPANVSAKLLTKADGVVRHDIDVTTVDPSAVQAANRWTGKPNKNFVLAPQIH
jgi:cytochrome c551/c552